MQLCLLLAAVLLLLTGCGGLPTNVVVLMPDDDGHTGRVAVANAAGHVDLDQPLAATGLTPGAPPGQPFIAKQRDVDESFAAAITATPHRPVAFILYFRSEAADVALASRPTVASLIAAVKAEPDVDVSVVGHTDAAGTDAFNMGLSLRRAESIRNALVEAGIPCGGH